MRKMWRSRKALSPVVAAIILIAVTVAVSIAVAAWMGALSFTFMKTEELRIVGVEFIWDAAPANRRLNITVRNTGTSASTVTDGKVGDAVYTVTDFVLQPGEDHECQISYAYTNGTSYNVAVITKAGNIYTYRATSPSP